jgi:hypothetical protein
MKRTLVSLFVFVASAALVSADAADSALGFVAGALAPKTKTVVALGSFTYADKNVGSSFSQYIKEKIGMAIKNQVNFELFSDENIGQILETLQKNAALGALDAQDGPSLNFKAVQAIITGKFYDDGQYVRLFVDLVEVGTGNSLGKTETIIPKNVVPVSATLLPDNYNDALFVLDELSKIKADDSGLKIKAWTSRGDGGTYRKGEQLVVNFYANKPCFVKIYHISATKEQSLIFPNIYQTNNFIPEMQVKKIPDESMPFSFDLKEPFGTEFILVYASTTQFAEMEEDADGTRITTGIRKRGIEVKAKSSLTSKATLSYTIIDSP